MDTKEFEIMKKNLAIFFGGKSAEHEISIMSAISVYENIDRSKYNVSLFGFNKSGEVYEFDEKSIYEDAGTMFKPERRLSFSEFTEKLVSTIDVVFPILHGPVGEDGKIQGYLEFLDIAYVGCGVTTSAVCMDKAITADVFKANGFKIPDYYIINLQDYKKDPVLEMKNASEITGYPLFVKPCNMGSSVGVTKVHDENEFRNAIKMGFDYDDHLIIQQAINARELECGVVGNYGCYEETEVGEVVPSHEFYDYEAKYSEDALSDIQIPASIDENLRKHIRSEALRAAECVGVSGLSRCDFLLDKDSGEIYINEINTMPGFTKFSMYPMLCQKIGYTYSELIDKLIELALWSRGA